MTKTASASAGLLSVIALESKKEGISPNYPSHFNFILHTLSPLLNWASDNCNAEIWPLYCYIIMNWAQISRTGNFL